MGGYLGFGIHVMWYVESGRGALGISFHRTDNLREQLRRGCQHLPNTQLGCLSDYNKTHMQSTQNEAKNTKHAYGNDKREHALRYLMKMFNCTTHAPGAKGKSLFHDINNTFCKYKPNSSHKKAN